MFLPGEVPMVEINLKFKGHLSIWGFVVTELTGEVDSD
jgi:hypothetical protein